MRGNMLQAHDIVQVEDSAEDDCVITAWPHVQSKIGRVVHVVQNHEHPANNMIAVEFPAPFAGGITCHDTCPPFRGQYIMEKNLSLCFEASRVPITVPQLDTPDGNRDRT